MLPLLKIVAGGKADQRIITAIRTGGNTQRLAEDELFRTYSYYIKEGTNKYPLSVDECFDAYSDAVLTVIHAIIKGSFEERSSLKTFLYRVFNNKCVDLVRKNSTKKSGMHHSWIAPDLIVDLSDKVKSILQKMVDQCDVDELKDRLMKIGETCRELLQLFSEGYPDREIAVRMNYNSADVVKTSRLRCLQKLKKEYSGSL